MSAVKAVGIQTTVAMGRTASGPRSGVESDDPLQGALRPPCGETEAQRQTRLRDEAGARRQSEKIDRYLKEEVARAKKERANERTILLLGQAGAGKTTILKQMRLIYAADKQASLRQAWTDVIYINVIMAVKLILEALETMEAQALERSAQLLSETRCKLSRINSQSCFSMISDCPSTATSSSAVREPSKALLARLRFAPFLSIESELRTKLGAFDRGFGVFLGDSNGSAPPTQSSDLRTSFGSAGLRKYQHTAHEVMLRAGWQEEWIQSGLASTSSMDLDGRSVAESMESNRSGWRRPYSDLTGAIVRRGRGRTGKEKRKAERTDSHQVRAQKEDDPSRLLSACLDEIWELWQGPSSAGIKARLCRADSAAYFLTHAARIARHDYCPIDDDILHARVRTVGATEERFAVDKSLSYRIIDVGGSRFQRNVWASFFEDATAIIFLAPISAFDECLEEDAEVNRIADSLQIWRQIVVSPLLYGVSLILFLNKMDLLQYKLLAGVQVKTFFSDYAGSNEYEEVWRYFRGLFHSIVAEHRHKAPTRSLYVHKTTATSTKEIKLILISTKDAILRHHLKESGFT